MAAKFHVASELQGPDETYSLSPHWVIGVARFANPVTYLPSERASFSTVASEAVKERFPRLVIRDCLAMSVSSSKNGHTISLQATIVDDGETKCLNEILPGDWVVANIVYDADAYEDVCERMSKGEPVNGWKDGMKFLGRAVSVRKQVAIDPATGRPRSAYSLQAVGFGELDTLVMYYPQLTRSTSIPVSLMEFGITVNDIITGKYRSQAGGMDINKIIPVLLTAIFGNGAWAKAPSAAGQPASPNLAYLVPQTVMGWMGLSGNKFSDLMRVLIGVQKYQQVAYADDTNADPWTLFQPDGAEVRDGAIRTKDQLIGAFPLESVPQSQTTAWGFISNYLNPPLNECLVGLRAHWDDGRVYPFLTVRQTPFTTEDYVDPTPFGISLDQAAAEAARPTPLGPQPGQDTGVVTRFLELPRWVVSPSMMYAADLGRSDATRVNLCFVHGTGPGVVLSQTYQFMKVPPIRDDLDILRSGVRSFMPSVNCFVQDQWTGPERWRDMMADITMGQHLTLNGTLSTVGIRAPVAPGDNLEFEGIVYHIESVVHQVRIEPGDGMRHFVTNFALSRGVRSEDDGAGAGRDFTFPNVNEFDDERPSIPATKEK